MRSEPAKPESRLLGLDTLRGVALLWMGVFHFCFDLAHQGLLQANFYADPFWTVQRTLILSLFLVCAGMGQAVAEQAGVPWTRFCKRLAQVAGCAVLVSAGSWLMFPHSYISFGVLHGMVLMLVLTRWVLPLRHWLWPMGLLLVCLPAWVQHPFFDSRATNWMGLVTHKPITEDYVPLLPWWGVMLWGAAAGQWLLARAPQVLAGATWRSNPWGARVIESLALLGRWSLNFYMLHQPVLLGGLALWWMARSA
jgi:uncharacterized membrane protein